MNRGQAPSTETIICLANSRKFSGRCIAGKRTHDGSWLRPVTARPGHEITETIRHYADGSTVQLLDIIELACIEDRPCGHQTENVLIHAGYRWRKVNSASWNTILDLVDPAADLWVNGYSTHYNHNNRVPEARLDECDGSLRLIALDDMLLHATQKSTYPGGSKPVVYARFEHQGQDYQLDVTDPEWVQACLDQGPGLYSVGPAVACISLTGAFQSYAYKLVASIITQERTEH